MFSAEEEQRGGVDMEEEGKKKSLKKNGESQNRYIERRSIRIV